MKLLSVFAPAVIGVALAVSVTACSSDDPEPVNGSQGSITEPDTRKGPVDVTVTGVMNNAEAGAYIENTVEKATELCNPQDQQKAATALLTIASVLEAYNGDGDDDDYDYYSKTIAREVRSAAAGFSRGEFDAAARAIKVLSQSFNVNVRDYLGVYTPEYDPEEEEYVWKKTGTSDNAIIYRADRENCEVSVTVSAESWNTKFDTYEEWWDYDWNYDYEHGIDNSIQYDMLTHWSVNVPRLMTVSMKQGGYEAVKAVVDSKCDEAGHSFVIKASAHTANINANVVTEGNDNQITERSSVHIGDTRLCFTEATVRGNNLCDRSKIESYLDKSHDYINANINNFFTDAVAYADVLDRIQVSATCNSLKEIMTTYDTYESEAYEIGNIYTDKKYAENFAKALNDYTTNEIKFGNTSYEQGNVVWKAEKCQDYYAPYYEYYDIVPYINLAGGASMTVEKWGKTGTIGASIKAVERVINTYKRVFHLD